MIWPIVDDAASIAAGTTIFTGETHTHRVTPAHARYFRYHLPSGFVVQGRDAHDNPLLLVNIITYLSGDHYGYNEFLLVDNGSGWQRHAHNNYQYDVAGIEGLTFPWLTLMALFAFSVVALAVASIWQILKGSISLAKSLNRP